MLNTPHPAATRLSCAQFSQGRQPYLPLDGLMIDCTKRRGSPVFNDALNKIAPIARDIVLQLTISPLSRDEKLISITPAGNSWFYPEFDTAINSVIAFAVLSRFDEYIQRELAARGYRRVSINGTGIDLLEAIRIEWKAHGDSALIQLLTAEALCYLKFVEREESLRNAIRGRIDEFKELAMELTDEKVA